MPRWVIGVLGAGVIVGIAVLVWQLQAAPDRPGRAAKPAPPGARPDAPAPPSSPRSGPGHVTPADDDAVAESPPRKTIEDVSAEYREKLLSRTVPNEIMRAVSGCYSGEQDDRRRMTISFTVEFNEDVAAVSDATVTESAGRAQLEECAVEVMNALTWRQPRAPNFVHKDEIEISINDLVKRQKQLDRREADEAGDD